jgi:hypothetical protein
VGLTLTNSRSLRLRAATAMDPSAASRLPSREGRKSFSAASPGALSPVIQGRLR